MTSNPGRLLLPVALRRFGLRLALLVGSFALVLMVGEIVARLTWTETPDRSPLLDPDLPDLKTIRQIDRPNVEGVFNGVYLRTNSQGLRGPEYASAPAPGVFRIAVGGDSVAMGSGVLERDAYPAVLERLLNAESSAGRFEVLNVGLAGINLERVVDRLERASEVYDPALLIYGFTINDIEGRAYEKLKPSQDSLRLIRRLKAIAASPSYLYKLVASRWLGLEEKLSPTKSAYPDEIRHNYFENPEAWADFVAALDRFAALARRREICGHVLLHTHLTELDSGHDYLGVYERVSQAAGQRGLSVTSSFPVFEGRAEPELWIDMLDTHPNREGHALMARALREGLRALPASCWEGHSSR